MKFGKPTVAKLEVSKESPKQGYWDKKDRTIQLSQAVNLAVQELGVLYDKSDSVGFPAETIKKFAKKYDNILSELKEELE